jgi:signal transduction histidine kinase/DNA-binding response OmpR family regulator
MDNSIINVLLVDDDEDDYLITSDLISEIERSKYAMEWASNYDDALKAITRHQHDVYLIDYRLGPNSGLDLIKEAISTGCQAPMILLTGQGDSEVDIMAMEAGAMDYLVKGQLDASSLERCIRYSIQRKRSEDIQKALFKISEATNLSSNLEELLKTIHQVLRTMIDTTNFCVALYYDQSDHYSFPYIVDQFNQANLNPHQMKKSLTDYIRRNGVPVLIDKDAHLKLIDDGEVELIGQLPLICLGVPLKTPQAVVGVVMLQSYTNPTLYTHADLDLLAFVSGHIAMAIERKRAEEQRKLLQEQLTRAEKMESLGILAGGVAHDLNNILGPLVAYPEIIKMKLPEDSPIIGEISKIEKSAQRASEVVQDLLTMARRGRYEMIPVEINEIVNSYFQSPDFLELEKKYKNVKVTVNIEEAMPTIHGSVSHLYKMIMNLVINAFEAMPNGGELIVKVKCRHIEKLTCGFDNIEPGMYVILTVSDNGLGIKKDDLKHLFEPFYTKKKMGSSGSGLGLAIVYGVIKDHNGYIDVRSKPDLGADFIIYLPIAQNPVIGCKSEPSINNIRGTENILVVDDLEEQRELASAILQSLGYKVHLAASGREAVEYLKHNQVDLIVLDMIMEEDFDGLQTYEEIVKFRPGQKAIIASGFSETERVKKAEKLGVGRYIRKPYTMQILGKAIREVMAKQPVEVQV